MKSTGIVRRLDDLGRVVIPREIRNSLKFMEGDALELFVENNSLILKKCDNSDEIAENCANWVNNNKEKIISVSFLGRETMCSFLVNGLVKKGYVTFNLCDKFDLNVAICYCAKQVGFEVEGI